MTGHAEARWSTRVVRGGLRLEIVGRESPGFRQRQSWGGEQDKEMPGWVRCSLQSCPSCGRTPAGQQGSGQKREVRMEGARQWLRLVGSSSRLDLSTELEGSFVCRNPSSQGRDLPRQTTAPKHPHVKALGSCPLEIGKSPARWDLTGLLKRQRRCRRDPNGQTGPQVSQVRESGISGCWSLT